jgi:hypothetical protein
VLSHSLLGPCHLLIATDDSYFGPCRSWTAPVDLHSVPYHSWIVPYYSSLVPYYYSLIIFDFNEKLGVGIFVQFDFTLKWTKQQNRNSKRYEKRTQ